MSRRPQAGHGAPNEARFGVSQVLAAGGLVYVAGQIGREPDGTPVADRSVAADAAKSIANLDAMLAAVGSSRDDLVHVQAHTTLGPTEAAPLLREHLAGCRTAGWCIRFPAFYAPEYRFELSAFAIQGGSMQRQSEGPVDAFGFARAVRAGAHVFVSGQRAQDDDGVLLHPSDLGAQYRVALERFVAAAATCGATPDDVVATWIYIVGLDGAGSALGSVAEHHAAVLAAGENRPTASLIGVSGLATEGALVEVTGLAVVDR